MPWSLANCAARAASRPATAAAIPPACRRPGRNCARAMFAVPTMPHRTCPLALIVASGRPFCVRIRLGTAIMAGAVRVRVVVERKRDPPALVVGDLDGVDDLLDPQAVVEVALVPVDLAQNLAGEVRGQVRVVQRSPGLPRAASGRVVTLRHFHVAELYVVGPRHLERLADAELLDQ